MPDNTDFFGAYPRYLILSLLHENLNRLLEKLFEEKNEDKNFIHDLANFYFTFIIKLLEINFLARMKANYLPYTKEHREKLYIWQTLCSIQKLISKGLIYKIFIS